MQALGNAGTLLQETPLSCEANTPLKVALVTAFPRDPTRPVGGVEAVSVNLARALGEIPGIDVHVVTSGRWRRESEAGPWPGVTVHRLPHSGKPVLLDAVGPGRRLMQNFLAQLQPDVIHAHDVYGLMVRDMALPRVFTIHGFIHADTRLSGKRLSALRGWLWERVETSSWAEQPHIISISPYVRERLTGISRGVIHDIDNPIAPECFAVARAESPATIFSAAVLSQRKNPLALVEAIALVRQAGIDVKLRLAGAPTEPHYVAKLEQRIAQLGLQQSVTLLGSIDSGRVRAELARASVFALVSFEEGAPMGIEEAMAAGVPVITSNRCGMPYMVRHGESGYLIDPYDTAAIAHRLIELLRNPLLRRTMGDKGRAIAFDRFHAATVARRTLQVYLQALRRS